MRAARHNGRGFTLLEMLVVIAVIALLAGLLLPVLSKVRQYSKKATARELMHQVEMSFKQYLVDYRKFPPIAVTMVDSNVLNVVRGVTYNELGRKYMDVTTNEMAIGTILDPWNRSYMMSIDNGMGGDNGPGYDQQVGAGPYGNVDEQVVLWSKGYDGKDTTEGDRKDDVRSWDRL